MSLTVCLAPANTIAYPHGGGNAAVVGRFRRSALIDIPGLRQVWMTLSSVRVAPRDLYFTIGETVGTPSARFPDCGLRWLYTCRLARTLIEEHFDACRVVGRVLERGLELGARSAA